MTDMNKQIEQATKAARKNDPLGFYTAYYKAANLLGWRTGYDCPELICHQMNDFCNITLDKAHGDLKRRLKIMLSKETSAMNYAGGMADLLSGYLVFKK